MRRYFIPCTPGFEALLAEEVRAAGAEPRPATGGVHFSAEAPVAWRLCLWSRVGIRVLEELTHGDVRTPDALYDLVADVPWHQLMSGNKGVGLPQAKKPQGYGGRQCRLEATRRIYQIV